ncbi:MAG TPA: hypothetical protein VH683_08850 [Thermoleophilaceae bacterium]|jgi:hypothetical protein
MRNRALHDALRNFALEAAALLTDELKAGAEVEFDVVEDGPGRGPALYRYEPRTDAFIEERWTQLRQLPAAEAACRELGAGASAWLRVNGLRGEQAEPALQAMLERLYEDSTSFGFPEERFDRVYQEVELTLYRDAVRARVIAPLLGAWMDAQRIELGDGLSLMRGDALDGPHDPSALLCVLERDVPADEPIPLEEATERFAAVVTAVRLWAPGAVALGGPGWRQTDHARWQPVAIGSSAAPRGEEWMLPAGEEQAFREFFTAMSGVQPPVSVAWALGRFEIGCAQPSDATALSDYLLALRGLLDAMSETGQASLGLRLAALCAEEGTRREVQDRLEAALALERFVMGGSGVLDIEAESPRELVDELEGHVRALLRDVLCGYLDADLKAVADDILLESGELHLEIEARDLRKDPEPDDFEPEPEDFEPEPDDFEPEPEPEEFEPQEPPIPRFEREPVTFEPELEWEEEAEHDTAEIEPVSVATEPVQHQLDGVTESADWGWDDPEDFSAPV